MKRVAGYLCLLMLLLLTGCSAFVKEPVVTVKDLTVVSLDGGGAAMELCLSVKNRNSFDVKLQGYSYDLNVMALPLAKGGARDEINFPAEGETEMRIPIRVAYGDLYQLLKKGPSPDSIPYHLHAGLDLDTPVGQMTIPVDRTGTYALPKQFRALGLLNKVTDLFRQDR